MKAHSDDIACFLVEGHFPGQFSFSYVRRIELRVEHAGFLEPSEGLWLMGSTSGKPIVLRSNFRRIPMYPIWEHKDSMALRIEDRAIRWAWKFLMRVG